MANYKVSELSVKKLKVDGNEVTFAIKATVTRLSHPEGFDDNDNNLMVHIQGLDEDGFERESVFLDGKVPVGTTKTLTKKEFYSDGDFDEIVTWQAKYDN